MRVTRRGQNMWIDSGDCFMGAAWFWPRRIAASSTAIVIVPGIAHEERTMNGGLAALAEALANVGLPALLIDLHGSSQSAGTLEDMDIGARWRSNIQAAVRHARSSGASRVVVVGVRLGFLLAAEALADEPLAALIAWAPIASGKRYVRELKLLQHAADVETVATGSIAIGGFSIPASILEHISALDLTKIEISNARQVMLCDAVENLDPAWLARLDNDGITIDTHSSIQIYPWLFGDTDQPKLPLADVRALTNWCRTVHDTQVGDPDPSPFQPAPRIAIEFVHHDRRIRETFVEIGPSRLTGVLSEPATAGSDHPVRLLMSTVGPGRTFTDFARDEASRGNRTLRFDFAGFGTSGRRNAPQGGELYTDDGCRDVLAAAAYLRDAGHGQIYGLGFCAGAWSMLQAEAMPELRALAAINVALYRQPGPAAAKFGKRTRQRLVGISPALAHNPVLRGVAARVRRTANKRREPIEWLVRLCSTKVRVLLAYADLDPGLPYLNGQMDKGVRQQLRHPFQLQTYQGLGHLAEGLSARTRLFQDIGDFFAGLDREPADAQGDQAPEMEPIAVSLR